jgi:hypothetical protein
MLHTLFTHFLLQTNKKFTFSKLLPFPPTIIKQIKVFQKISVCLMISQLLSRPVSVATKTALALSNGTFGVQDDVPGRSCRCS